MASLGVKSFWIWLTYGGWLPAARRAEVRCDGGEAAVVVMGFLMLVGMIAIPKVVEPFDDSLFAISFF